MALSRRNLLGAAAASAVTAAVLNAGQAAEGQPTPGPANKGMLRLGTYRHVPAKWDLKGNFDAFLKALDETAAKRVELLVTPECHLDGYAAADSGSSRAKLFSIAQEVGKSEYLERIAQEARQRRISIVCGFTQKDGQKLYDAAGLWDSQGQLTGVYHKTHIQTHDKQFDPGQSLPVFKSPWGPLGIMICADRRWPETARVLRLQGARLILCPSYGMRHEANEWWMRTRAYENDCFIAFAHPSVGFVVNPAGNLVAKLDGGGKEEVLAVDIDLSKADVHGHLDDRRPELYGIIAESQKSEVRDQKSER
ncbi:MAG: carbon-nitrogen hydrolase family protein [Planctomycetota bacterium]|nr:carbon-nitrogen hydrolase family protein [Planctomycetota bacterium]